MSEQYHSPEIASQDTINQLLLEIDHQLANPLSRVLPDGTHNVARLGVYNDEPVRIGIKRIPIETSKSGAVAYIRLRPSSSAEPVWDGMTRFRVFPTEDGQLTMAKELPFLRMRRVNALQQTGMEWMDAWERAKVEESQTRQDAFDKGLDIVTEDDATELLRMLSGSEDMPAWERILIEKGRRERLRKQKLRKMVPWLFK